MDNFYTIPYLSQLIEKGGYCCLWNSTSSQRLKQVSGAKFKTRGEFNVMTPQR